MIDEKSVAAVLETIESTDPLDLGALQLHEDELRAWVCQAAVTLWRDLQREDLSPEDRTLTLLASIARLLMDNVVMHAQRFQRLPEVRAEFDAVLDRMKRKPED